MTTAAFLQARNLDIRVHAAHGIFERNLQIVADVVASLGAVSPLAGSAAEYIAEAENVAENVAEIGKSVGVEPAARDCRDALMAIAVISRPLLRIAQNAVRLRRLFEFFLGVLAP